MNLPMLPRPINAELFVALTPDALCSPVSLEELEQLVQMNVPEAQILQDVEMRPLSCVLDGASERMLLKDGASLRLIRRLRGLLHGSGIPQAA
jgi:hypothetical protein